MRTLPTVSLCAVVLVTSGWAQSDVLTPHDVARMQYVSSAAISPDGTKIAFTRGVPREPGVDEDGGAWSELHVYDLQKGAARPYVSDRSSFRSVAWMPDGSGLSFLAKRGDDEHTSLYVLPIDGGEARRAFGLDDRSVGSYDVAPDGERVVVVATPPEGKEAKKLKGKGFKQEIYEEDWRAAQVWVGTLFDEDDEPRVLESVEGHVYQAHWSPVDDRLLISRAPTPLVDDRYMRQRVAVISSEDGSVLASIDNPGKLGQIAWSPDGSQVALIAAGDINDPNAGRLLLASSTGGALVDAIPDFEADVEVIAWQDADTILYVASHGVWSALEEVEVAGGQGGARKVLVETGGPILTSFDLTPDGQHAAFVANAPDHMPELYAMSHGEAAPRRLTDSNPWLADRRLAPQEVVEFEARDGLRLEGLLIRPLDEVEGRRYPLILYVHGGPEAHHSNGWLTRYSNPGQVAAARGIAVFHTNYRGSTGRGVAFSKLSQGDPAGQEFDDLVDAVDHLIDIGLVDRERVGVTGGSYGGYATAWCTTKFSDRFAAGVMFVGISNKVSKVGTTDIPDEEYYVHALKRPWENWQFFMDRSPIYHADGARTPLLILHGKDDPRVNVGQSRELYRHLKVRGETPVRLVLYPGEGHGNRKAAARLDYNLRSLRWMEHYLAGPGGQPPPYEIEYNEPEESPGT